MSFTQTSLFEARLSNGALFPTVFSSMLHPADRDMDMAITGQRHAFVGRYRAGCDEQGRLRALDLELYSNGACQKSPTKRRVALSSRALKLSFEYVMDPRLVRTTSKGSRRTRPNDCHSSL